MAYKTNSKEAIKNIRNYITTLFDPSNYGKDESEFPHLRKKQISSIKILSLASIGAMKSSITGAMKKKPLQIGL